MGSGEPARVAVVVANASTLEATLARVEDTAGERPAITVFCPGPIVSDRVEAVLSRTSRRGTVEAVDPFTAGRVSDVVATAAADRVVVGAEVPFPASDLESRLPGVPVDGRPPGAGPARERRQLRRPTGPARRATIFVLALGFYLLLGEVSPFDVVTGVVSAVVVVLVLSRVTFAEAPSLRRSLPRAGRAVVFVPYLLWEILLANLALAVVLLRPGLPIEPSFVTVPTDAGSDLERAVLANSITLTPGTLAVDVTGSTLVVHTLTAGSRTSLREGGLARAVRFVFRGRRPARGEGADG